MNSLWDYIIHSNRIKSLIWRAGAFGAVAAVNSIATDILHVGAPALVVTIVGLAAGEATKAINNWLSANPLA